MTEGIVLLDKPAGQTSFQSLGFLKKALGTGRVGHAGTLDRFADGLLVVLAGRMTRLCALATSLDKEYRAVFSFGRGTDTLDPEGATTSEGRVPSQAEIEGVLPRFRGTIQQVPPEYSAIHVQGRRASEAARSGLRVQLAPRSVTISSIDLVEHSGSEATFHISCSKGTYVRSIARDIAAALGTCAFVTRLRRTRIGGFLVENAHTPDSLDLARDVLPPAAFFAATPGLGTIEVKERFVASVSRGRRLSPELFFDAPAGDGPFGAFAPDGRLIAVIEKDGGKLSYLAAFPEEPGVTRRQAAPGGNAT